MNRDHSVIFEIASKYCILVRGCGREEQLHIQGAVAARVQEGREELLHVQVQGGRPRPSRDDFETEIAREKLKQIGFGDIKIFNNEHHKIERLLDENVSYMIDDDEGICKNASDNNICALYFKNNASNRLEKENVINVNNWGEIYKYLMLNEEEK